MKRQSDNYAWRIGGPQGSGIDRLATVFGRVCAASGLYLFARREYHSNIIGRHSYADLCISTEAVTSHRDSLDMLVTFDTESLARHIHTIADNGFVLFAESDMQVSLENLPYLDARLKIHLLSDLADVDLPATTGGLLEQARARGVQLVSLPYNKIVASLADEFGLSRKQASLAINTVAVAASSALLGFDDAHLHSALETIFGEAHPALKLNKHAVTKAYQFIKEHHGAVAPPSWLHNQTNEKARLYLNGCQSVALGKLAAGLTFQTYYPISPASDESQFLEAQAPVPSANGEYLTPLVLQVEDEIAAATMACGAALTGARSATATSGPGFCLMSECLGWAGMNEVPLVVNLYQRGGPSTGLPTRTEQGDLGFVTHAGQGEFPRLVMASGDIEDCFYDACQAFNYAERYQLPVIHMLDKALASSSQTVSRFDYKTLNIDRGVLFTDNVEQRTAVERFVNTESGISPRPLLGQHNAQHWLTGAEHDGYGQVSEDPVVREQMMEKRLRKLQQIQQDLSREEKLNIYGNDDAEFTLVTWGSTKGAAWEAVKQLRDNKIKVRAIQIKLLLPFPSEELLELITSEQTLIVAECNYSGQLNKLMREYTGQAADYLMLKYNGRPMTGDAVAAALLKIVKGESEHRIVFHNPYE